MMNKQTEAFDEGYHAWCNGYSIGKNPYKNGSVEYLSWSAGYSQASFDVCVENEANETVE